MKKKRNQLRMALAALGLATLTACSGVTVPSPSLSPTTTPSTVSATVTPAPKPATKTPAKDATKADIAGKQAADKTDAKAKIVAAAQVAAAKHVDDTLTQLGYGADKGWKTTMTAADWAKVAMNNPGYMVQGTSFAKTPEEAAAVAVNNSAVAGTQAQKADPANWKLVYNDQCMVYPSMAYQDQNGNIFWGSDFRECGVAVWVNVASGGSFRLLCDNATKVAPVATPLPASLPQVAPNPAVVPPVVHKPKPPVVTPPVVVKYMYVCDTIAKTGKTIRVTAEEARNPRYAAPGSPNCQPVVPPKMIEVCVLADNSKITIKESAFDAKLYTHGWEDCKVIPPKMVDVCILATMTKGSITEAELKAHPGLYSEDLADCVKPIMACVIGSGNQNLVEVPADYNHDIYSTDIADCVSTCACEHPPVVRCDVTTWTIVSISQEEAKNTDRYKDISADACKPPVEECPPGQTPNPNYPATSPDKCLEKKDTDPGNYHTNPGVPPVAADPAPSAPGLDHTTTETGGRGDTVVDTPTNTDPTAPSGVTAPGATEPNATPVTQVNEGGATETDGTNSGTVTSNPIDAPTVVTPPAASAPVDDSAAQAAAQAAADQAAQEAADVAALAATRAQAQAEAAAQQAAADQAAQAQAAQVAQAQATEQAQAQQVAAQAAAQAQAQAAADAQAQAIAAQQAAAEQAAAQQAAQTQAAQAAQVAANAAAAQPAPTTAPTAVTTAPDAPVMAAVTAPADNG